MCGHASRIYIQRSADGTGRVFIRQCSVEIEYVIHSYLGRANIDCDPCPLKLRCCPKEPTRKIPRDVNEAARDLARGLTQTEGYRVSARQRKMIETGFADMKRNLGLTRLRLRGLTGANDEFLLAATVQNLRRLAKAIWPSPEPTTSPTTA